jgi:hypothetical protein
VLQAHVFVTAIDRLGYGQLQGHLQLAAEHYIS